MNSEKEKTIAQTLSYQVMERIKKLNYDKGALFEIITMAQQSHFRTKELMSHGVENSSEYREMRIRVMERIQNDDLSLGQANEISKEFIDNIHKENEISWTTLKFFLHCDTRILKMLSKITWQEFTELDNE